MKNNLLSLVLLLNTFTNLFCMLEQHSYIDSSGEQHTVYQDKDSNSYDIIANKSEEDEPQVILKANLILECEQGDKCCLHTSPLPQYGLIARQVHYESVVPGTYSHEQIINHFKQQLAHETNPVRLEYLKRLSKIQNMKFNLHKFKRAAVPGMPFHQLIASKKLACVNLLGLIRRILR